MLLRTEHQVVAVPAQAVQHAQDSLYVYVVKPDSTVQRQTVTAEDRGTVMVITKGLDAGQAIVLDGQSRLQDGTLVAATQRRAAGQAGGMSISTPFIHRPIATSLVMAALVLVGIAAYPLLPVAPLPRVDFPTIVVTGQLPGASPETMAATVAQPLETQIAQIPGVAQLTSVSVLGTTSVTVQFDLDRNIDGAAGDIQAAIQGASGQLPKIMPGPPTYRKVNPSDAPIMILAAQSDALPLIETDDYAENVLSQQISQISGVAQVLIGGQQKRAVRVEVDPDRLAAMGMTLEDVRNLLVSATVNAPKGTIDGAHQVFHALRQRPAHAGERVQQCRAGLPQRRGGPGARHRPRHRRPGEPPARRLAERQARHPADHLQAAGRQRHRHGGAHQGGTAAAGGLDPAFDPRQHHHGPHA